jgi:hypothetical protein
VWEFGSVGISLFSPPLRQRLRRVQLVSTFYAIVLIATAIAAVQACRSTP